MPHPAKFNDRILEYIDSIVIDYFYAEPQPILDPFGGTGKLKSIFPNAICLDIEWEWALESGLMADATLLPFEAGTFPLVITSPTYGNRMADHHIARDKSKRMTYRHQIGHELNERNTGRMQWGRQYRSMHKQAWSEIARVMQPFGLFIVNVKDHIRKGKRINVVDWHITCINKFGFRLISMYTIETEGMRFGQNSDLRIDNEQLLVFVRRND